MHTKVAASSTYAILWLNYIFENLISSPLISTVLNGSTSEVKEDGEKSSGDN